MNARSFWFSATKSGSKVIATVRGRAKVTRLSSRMRPGRALITQMRLPRNAASRRSCVTSSTVGLWAIQRS